MRTDQKLLLGQLADRLEMSRAIHLAHVHGTIQEVERIRERGIFCRKLEHLGVQLGGWLAQVVNMDLLRMAGCLGLLEPFLDLLGLVLQHLRLLLQLALDLAEILQLLLHGLLALLEAEIVPPVALQLSLGLLRHLGEVLGELVVELLLEPPDPALLLRLFYHRPLLLLFLVVGGLTRNFRSPVRLLRLLGQNRLNLLLEEPVGLARRLVAHGCDIF
mmetsp:Transcript_8542/g.23085  ORF Transcript_8542/g.23085 Transcript_8542/m.23085 type:complete len:217 (-) Transcript_8542:47-697(-)